MTIFCKKSEIKMAIFCKKSEIEIMKKIYICNLKKSIVIVIVQKYDS